MALIRGHWNGIQRSSLNRQSSTERCDLGKKQDHRHPGIKPLGSSNSPRGWGRARS